jgi:hypothetical protein
VTYRNTAKADKRDKLRTMTVPLQDFTPQRIRSIQNHKLFASLCTAPHGEKHGRRIGIIPGTYILKINNQGVHPVQGFHGGFINIGKQMRVRQSRHFVKKAVYRQTAEPVRMIFNLVAGSKIPPYAVFWPQKYPEIQDIPQFLYT